MQNIVSAINKEVYFQGRNNRTRTLPIFSGTMSFIGPNEQDVSLGLVVRLDESYDLSWTSVSSGDKDEITVQDEQHLNKGHRRGGYGAARASNARASSRRGALTGGPRGYRAQKEGSSNESLGEGYNRAAGCVGGSSQGTHGPCHRQYARLGYQPLDAQISGGGVQGIPRQAFARWLAHQRR